MNEGRVKNHGYEITLKWSDKVGDFRYSISPSIAFARNKIIEMLEVPPMYDYLRRTGLSVGQRFGYDLFELYQEGTEERYKAAYGVEMPTQLVSLKYGDAVYVDLNGDGLIDQNDQKPLGYPDNPEITWSVNAQLHWKGLEIGYTLNKPTWMPLFNFVRFYASGQNLLTFANFKGNDPEAPGQGLDFGVRYPMTRVFNFGVQVNF